MNHKQWIVVLTLLSVMGCAHIGPRTVTRDRFDYNTAISNSWKEQTLMNIVKIRYADMPLFVEVASIVSGYTLESSVNVGSALSLSGGSDIANVGVAGKFIDRPTITYAPITGSQFNKTFMTPIPPGAILFLMQSGWTADLVFTLTVNSINGLRSQVMGGSQQRVGDNRYYRVVELFKTIQKSGAIGMRIKQEGETKEDATVMFFHRESLAPEMEEALNELGQLLGLQPGAQEIRLSYGVIPATDQEISLLTMSMLQIMIKLATEIDVPAEHVTDGRTLPTLAATGDGEQGDRQLMHIGHSTERPDTAFTTVKYRDHWFWIDDRDFKSKRTFAFLMILFSLSETGGKEGLPLVTIPAG